MIGLVFKSNQSAKVAIASGIAMAVAYKFFKIILRTWFSLDDEKDYYLFQSLCTGARLVNAAIGFLLIRRAYENTSALKNTANRKFLTVFLLYPVSYFFLRNSFYSVTLPSPSIFTSEIFFNLFTGVSEEILFRVLLFGGLWHFMGFWRAAWISSLLFSLWHYDVVNGPLEFVSLTAVGLVYSVALGGRVGLIALMLVHFAQDQIHFGLSWDVSYSVAWRLSFTAFDIIFFLALAKIAKHHNLIPTNLVRPIPVVPKQAA